MARPKKNETTQNEELNNQLEELKNNISNGSFDEELKKFIKVSNSNYEELETGECFKLLLNKFSKKEFKFNRIWG